MTQSDDRKVVGWESMLEKAAERLRERTGADLTEWNERVREANPASEPELRSWLAEQGVGGYSQDLLVYERYGYPEFMLTKPQELIDEQYADRPELRPICDAVLDAALSVGDVTVQARKTYISLVSPKRTFAIVKASTKSRVDVGLNLPDARPGGRLLAAKSLPKGNVRIALSSVDEVDGEVTDLLCRCYEANS